MIDYPSGTASLFSVMARDDSTSDAPAPAPAGQTAVLCSCCMSDNTRLLDILTHMYRCVKCGEVFYASCSE